MATRHFGERVRRNEDPRLLKGQGTYVDDVDLPNTAHAAVLRSPHAHARILRIDCRAARALPGVLAVYTNADLGDSLGGPLPLLIPHPTLRPRTQYALARDRVRHVGEPVALVVAESRYVAEDALDLIEVEYEPLPAVVDAQAALAPGAPRVHEDLPDNVAAHYVQRVGDYEAAARSADLVLRERLFLDRSAGHPMEGRAVLAHFDRRDGLTIWDSTQAPIPVRKGIARLFGLPEHQVRVVAPDVGGGFGPKIMMFYPEEITVPFAAMKLRRPVKWVEDRREHFVSTNQERGQVHEVEIAVRKDGTIVGLKDVFVHDSGAYVPYGLIVPIVASTTLPGPYKLHNYHAEFTAVFTHTVIVSPYRGAGRPHGVFVMERILDRVARELGIDRMEVRRRNLIQPDEFPYHYGLTYQDGQEVVYDSGQYELCQTRALERIGYADWPRVQAEARRQGRYLGLGLANYVEGSGVGPYEGARVSIDSGGRISLLTGVGTQGQGHYTSFAQIVADELGVDPGEILVVTGDTGAFPWGTGTFASRAAVVAGNATYRAAVAVRDKAKQIAARLFECSPADVELRDGKAFVRGSPDRSHTLAELANAANPLRGTLPPDFQPGLEGDGYFNPPQATFANGVHACVIEVDPATGFVKILKYVVVHDCGKIINPMIVDGQVLGGVAQGVGGALYERLVYDESGQLLTASFMDFLLPTAIEAPSVEIEHVETPTPLNPLGVKGAGEAGVIPVPAMLAQAIEDALAPFAVKIDRMPLTPAELLAKIRAGG